MNENEPEKPKAGCGCLMWTVAGIAVVLLLSLMMPSHGRMSVRALQMKAGSNARQITGLMMTYAADYNGLYTDAHLPQEGLTANAAFRELVKEGLVQDETIFGSPYSSFIRDKDLGAAPDFPKALEPGENHWMMVAGQNNTTASYYPIILENAVDGTWPPRWLPGPLEIPEVFRHPFLGWLPQSPPPPGRSWKGNTILMTCNDASMETVKLVEKEGQPHLPDGILKPKGAAPLPNFKLLDVERKK